MLSLTKSRQPELTGPITISSEWNHSCTSQCSNPCTVNRLTMPEVAAGNGDAPKIPHPRDPQD